MAKIALTIGLPALAGLFLAVAPTAAHPPDRTSHPVRPRIDVIPPLGNRLPMSYAARYNRPAYLTGLITYWIEPTSQEAMAWHRAVHRGYYANHAPRMETHYMYPKPWEIFGVGGNMQPALATDAAAAQRMEGAAGVAPTDSPRDAELAPPVELLPVPHSDR